MPRLVDKVQAALTRARPKQPGRRSATHKSYARRRLLAVYQYEPDWRYRCRLSKRNLQWYIHRYDNNLPKKLRIYTRVSVDELPANSKCFMSIQECKRGSDPDAQTFPCRKNYTIFATRDDFLEYIGLKRRRSEATVRLGSDPRRMSVDGANFLWARTWSQFLRTRMRRVLHEPTKKKERVVRFGFGFSRR